MKTTTRVQLSVLMFLEFFIWGAWYTTIGVYMTNHNMGDLTHWPYTVNPIAAIIAPFFVGLIADRYFATQKVLGVLHIMGAVFMFLTPSATGNPTVFILLLLAYNICYMPTMGLANTICFHKMTNQEKEFPLIRVFGTIGWIIAGLIISYVLSRFAPQGLMAEQTAMPLYMTATASLLLGLYSFTLPNTPPPAAGKAVSARSIIGVDAFKQLASKPFFIFLASSFLICIPLAAYYNFTQIFLESAKFENIAATQTLGQVSETLFMVAMPLFFARFGVKWMLGAGMLAWVLRYTLFALGAPDLVNWMILTGIALHGICYDFFFVTGQIYVDTKASPEIRGQAQGLIVFVTYGLGMIVGAQIAGIVYNSIKKSAPSLTLLQWQSFWWLPAVFAAVVLLVFLALFRDSKKTA
ncbi:MAG: nucleoside permease [Bacteroidetes bacterium]|nr:nucleoside permease [Bacteroidota bacterium]